MILHVVFIHNIWLLLNLELKVFIFINFDIMK